MSFCWVVKKEESSEKEQTFKPDQSILVRATYYGEDFHGRPMANQENFDMHDETTVATARRDIPLGTVIELVNPKNGNRLIGVVRDRMSSEWLRTDPNRIDLSFAGARFLGFIEEGKVPLIAKFYFPKKS